MWDPGVGGRRLMQKGSPMSLLIFPLTSPDLKLANSVSTSGFPKLQQMSRRLPACPSSVTSVQNGVSSLPGEATFIARQSEARYPRSPTSTCVDELQSRIRTEIMSSGQIEKASRFRALHDRPGPFVIPNPWDVASTRILEGIGFEAVATSSAASACAVGRPDGELTRDEALAHARMIVDATDLPVSADLERGFGDAPDAVAETIRLAAEAGWWAAQSKTRQEIQMSLSTISALQ